MSQETNLNVSPYFDDFDPENEYYKVLFKPGYPVQARELNTIQSMLQYQTEQFGKHIFKEGSVVIPGQIRLENPLYLVQIEPVYNGIPISLYFDNLKGAKIRSLSTGVTAEIVYLLRSEDSERGNYTLYLKYLTSGGENFDIKTFSDGETLVLDTSVTYGNTVIDVGEGFCNTISSNASSAGSGFSVEKGVYFVRGFFATVESQTILLDQYNTVPTYKIGFSIDEQIITSNEDSRLYDNAKGFSNYAAPGADRFRLNLILTKKTLEDSDNESFVEIARIRNGVLEYLSEKSQYSIIKEELARRTFDESGNYYVKPFTVYVRDSLNDKVLSYGVFTESEKTIEGNTPSEDLMIYEIGPGKAYVNGFDIESISAKLLDVKKPRETVEVQNQVIPFNAGTLIKLNNCYGSPYIGIGTNSKISMMDSRIGESASVSSGSTIGFARVYDFIPESSYIDNTSRFNIRLFDIQTFTKITLNTPFSEELTTPVFIEGKTSKSSGYLKDNLPSGETEIILYETSGEFLDNEQIIINGNVDNRLITSSIKYTIDDVKSLYSNNDGTIFNADIILNKMQYILPPGTTFKVNNGVVNTGFRDDFIKKIKVGDIVSYSNQSGGIDPIYNVVSNISAGGTSFVLSGLTTVTGVCDGNLSDNSFEVTNIFKMYGNFNTRDSSLVTYLGKDNIKSINFENFEISQRRDFIVNSFTSSTISISIDPNDEDVYFREFDEDLYLITYSDGTIEKLRDDQFNLDLSGKTVTFVGLSVSSGSATVKATIRNLRPNSKIKKLNKVSSIIINNSIYEQSGIGTGTLNDGLNYSPIYGTRVQDRDISLNVPDVIRVLAIYESNDENTARFPSLKTLNGTQNYVVGEFLEGVTSGCVALITKIISADEIEYINLNTNNFAVGEKIIGKESNEESIVSLIFNYSKNIGGKFLFDNGARETFYDFSRIVRNKNSLPPKKSIKILYQNYTIDSSDTGEFITANSYNENNFKRDISLYENRRLSDYIDIRPRVKPYVESDRSPFEFESRKFDYDGNYSRYILTPDQNIILSYSFYVGRIDRIFLNPDGTFSISTGKSAEVPLPPNQNDNSLNIAEIYLPPYIYNTKDVIVNMNEHKRYRMADISKLEERIVRLEEYSTLNMLEINADKLTIKDAETGLDRFKSGFFVDNFSSHTYHDADNPNFTTAIDISTNTLRPSNYTTSLDLVASLSMDEATRPSVDASFGVRKTGDLITLNYNSIEYLKQPYASKTESVTPFLVRYWEGTLQLNPSVDMWYEEKYITKNSYSENTINIPREDEVINKTLNQSVINNVYNEPENSTPGSGLSKNQWIKSIKSTLTGVTKIAGVPVEINGTSKSTTGIRTFKNETVLRIVVDPDDITNKDRNLIRQLLPTSVANDFLTEVNEVKENHPQTNKDVSIVYRPELVDNTSESTLADSTSTTSTSTSSSVVTVPPEIKTTYSTSESDSHYTEPIRYLRSRNVEFISRALKASTSFYAFFQGVDVSNYIIPKLLEIQMISGKFEIGETVISDPTFTQERISFRVCKPNHKTGPIDGSNPPLIQLPPSVAVDFTTGEILPQLPQNDEYIPDLYLENPYTKQLMESDYAESSTILNVDTNSLKDFSYDQFYGNIAVGMTLIGKSSGAIAVITNRRLISDSSGTILGSLFIPPPDILGNPKWINGTNKLILVDTPTLQGDVQEFVSNLRVNESSASGDFTSSGTYNVTETNILTTANITIYSSYNVSTNTTINTTTTTNTYNTTISENIIPGVTQINCQLDPLAQSFFVSDESGIFITDLEVFFETKDDTYPVIIQIRTMSDGVPTNVVVPFGEVILYPNQVKTSPDGSIPTRITFPSPVYLNGPSKLNIRGTTVNQLGSEYAIVLLSPSPNYRVFILELGQEDILTGNRISIQPTLGSLFKSQNSTTWTPAQLEDLKYTLYRASFVNEGILTLYNNPLSYKDKHNTISGNNFITTLSKKIILNFGENDLDSSTITNGDKIIQGSASGILVSSASSITNLIIENSGFGYEEGTYNGITLSNINSTGYDATATIIIDVNGEISSVTVDNGGFNYSINDTLEIPESESSLNVGFGAKFRVSGIGSTNSLVLDEVQGNFNSGISSVYYINSTGSEIGISSSVQSIVEDPYYDGLHMKIKHVNHCMHSKENYVRISTVLPLESETRSVLSAELSPTDTEINLVSSSGFDTFEGKPVSQSNPGYAFVAGEVVEYYSISGNTLQVSPNGRLIDSMIDILPNITRPSGTPVAKYQLNGISLRRINKLHNFAIVDAENHPINLDSYFIKIETKSTDFDGNQIGTNRENDLYFNTTDELGLPGAKLTQNIQYEVLQPIITNILPPKTNLSCRVRTTSGTSISGNEKSFEDNGFSDISLKDLTYFRNPQLICSTINENRNIDVDFINKKSFEMQLITTTEDSRVSPVIDTTRTSIITTSNLINAPLGINEDSNYSDDDSIRSVYDEKHSAVYISKIISMQLPANSLKVILSASHTDESDVRVLYRIFNEDSPKLSSNYELFPGYSNYSVDGVGILRVIDKSKNDGSADKKSKFTSDKSFKDYEYSVDDLPSFTAFSIKIVLSSKNQANPPLIKDLRCIATTKPSL